MEPFCTVRSFHQEDETTRAGRRAREGEGQEDPSESGPARHRQFMVLLA